MAEPVAAPKADNPPAKKAARKSAPRKTAVKTAAKTAKAQLLAAQADYDWVANGRFKGGHITRHYADPGNGIEAVQLELSQRTYMDEDSFDYDEAGAARLQALLQRLLGIALHG